MPMNDVWVFTNDHVKVTRVSDANLKKWQDKPNVAINPILDDVLGIPPEEWKLVDGNVVPKSPREKVEYIETAPRPGYDLAAVEKVIMAPEVNKNIKSYEEERKEYWPVEDKKVLQEEKSRQTEKIVSYLEFKKVSEQVEMGRKFLDDLLDRQKAIDSSNAGLLRIYSEKIEFLELRTKLLAFAALGLFLYPTLLFFFTKH